jgi:hypothetical protein
MPKQNTGREDGQFTYKRNIEARSRNHCCCGKAINSTYCKCVSVALVIQHAKRMRRFILPSVACLAVPYFSTLSHKRHDFRKKKVTEHKICVLISSTSFTRKISHCERTERDIIINLLKPSGNFTYDQV